MGEPQQRLTYVDAERVRIAGLRGEGMEVRSRDGAYLGEFQGVVIDLERDQVRYLVVRPRPSIPRVALTSASGARVDCQDRVVRVDLDSLTQSTQAIESLPYRRLSVEPRPARDTQPVLVTA